MIRNKTIITAAVLASFSNLTFAEDFIIELKGVSVQSPADQNTALNLKKTNSTANWLGLNAIDIPASVENLDIDTIRMRGDSNIHEAVSRTTGISDISNLGAGVS